MRQLAFVATIDIAMLLAAAAEPAQRPPAAKFDLTKPLTLRGTVTQIDWATPNVHILMKAPRGEPRPALWAVQLESSVTLAGNGWIETSLPIGEIIVVDGFAARGRKQSDVGQVRGYDKHRERLFIPGLTARLPTAACRIPNSFDCLSGSRASI